MTNENISSYWNEPIGKILEHYLNRNQIAFYKYFDIEKDDYINIYVRNPETNEETIFEDSYHTWIYKIVDETEKGLIVERLYPNENYAKIESISQELLAMFDNANRLVSTAKKHLDWYGEENHYVQEKGTNILSAYYDLVEWWVK